MSSTPRMSALGSVLLLTTLAMSACSQPSEPSTSAAEAPAPSSESASASASASKESSNLGVRLCITNNSTIPATVIFTRKDSGNGGTISRGDTTCGEGTFGSGDDIAGGITWDSPDWKTQFSASNPWFGAPSARVSERDPAGKNQCLAGSFDVNESRSGENGLVRLTLARRGDGQWKEFTLRIDPSERLDPSGTRRSLDGTQPCPGGTREHV